MADEAKAPREEAEKILRKIGSTVGLGRDTDDVVGALVGVGLSLLAIHDELRAIRLKYAPSPREGQYGTAHAPGLGPSPL